MEQENFNEDLEVEIEQKHPVFKVTPLSKYLAMILFILMPFIGGWIGYTYAPEKVVEKIVEKEVEKVIYKEIFVDNSEGGTENEYTRNIKEVKKMFSKPSNYYSDNPLAIEIHYELPCITTDPELAGAKMELHTGDGGSYPVDCLGFVTHTYEEAGTYTASYSINRRIIGETVVHAGK